MKHMGCSCEFRWKQLKSGQQRSGTSLPQSPLISIRPRFIDQHIDERLVGQVPILGVLVLEYPKVYI